MKVCVTGGAGFIGSHLVDLLVANGRDVTVIDCLVPEVHRGSETYHNPGAEYIIHDYDSIDWASLPQFDCVYHLAARVAVGESAYMPEKYMRDNTMKTLKMLGRLRDAKPGRLVVASSMSVYGANAMPGESDRVMPQSFYGLSKFDQEQQCIIWGDIYGVPVTALRLFNTYGERQALGNPYTGVVAIFINKMLNGEPPIIYDDGYQARDFVYAGDVARAFSMAGSGVMPSGVYNVGTGTVTQIRELARRIASLLDFDGGVEIPGIHRPGDVPLVCADTAKIEKHWQPEWTLDDGLARTIAWAKEQGGQDTPDAHGEFAQWLQTLG